MEPHNRRHKRALPCAGLCFMVICAAMLTAATNAIQQDAVDSSQEVDRATDPGTGSEEMPRSNRDPERGDRQGVLGQRARDRSGTGRPLGRWRNPSQADIELFMEVVKELNPDWGKTLDELGEQDEEAFRKAISNYGRRLWQLVELRKQNPGLYTLRIKEIRTRQRLQELGIAYRLALAEQRSEDVVRLLTDIQEKAQEQIDLQMRVRGEELAAMADALEELRRELLLEATERVQRAQQLVERVIAAPVEPSPVEEEATVGQGPSVDAGSRSDRPAPADPSPVTDKTSVAGSGL